ncbi:hypothetical protein [Ferrimonas kyonanensis]|uniref:hypothetical protein n=1 Tax=Ferrimonas kyonanensis TaxID=364763 RepID=UPI0012EC8242|nr:hypothetical protein [Ferrimonas kyonanensis]
MNKFIAIGGLISLISFNSFGKVIDCLELIPNETLQLQITKKSGFQNCFSIINLPENHKIAFMSISTESINSKIILHDIRDPGEAKYIAEYKSDNKGTTFIDTNSTDRSIAFVYRPLNYLSYNKNMDITYMIMDDTARVIIEVNNGNYVHTNTPVKKPSKKCERGVCRHEP